MQFPNSCIVELLAFGKEGETRKVKIPEGRECNSVTEFLEAVFYYGQNDIQPQRHPSVSAGDLVKLANGEVYLYAAVGIMRLSLDQYERYVAAKQYQRLFLSYEFEKQK